MSVPDYAHDAALANPDEVESGEEIWCVTFGAYGSTHIYVWAPSLEKAFETAVEYLDDEKQCGHFTFLGSGDYEREARRLGRSWDPSDPDMDVVEAVEVDLTPVGWTTLECERALGRSAFIPSWEWTAREVWDDERHLIEERALGEIEEGEDW